MLRSATSADTIASGRYLLTRREKWNEATDSELLDMAKRFWHSEDIARVPGNFGEYTLQESALSTLYENQLGETTDTPH